MLRVAYTLGIALIVALALNGCTDTNVAISGDGSQVAVSHGGALWVADVDKENWRKVPLDAASAGSPTWSPDDRYVLFELQPEPQVTVAADKPEAGLEKQQEKVDESEASPANQKENADKPEVGSVKQQEKAEPAYAALFDSLTGTTTRLAADVGPPFAWRSDGDGFVALHHETDSSSIAWFAADGTPGRTIALPKEITHVSELAWLPESDDIAFIALHGEPDAQRIDLFRTQGDHARRLTETGDVVGIGIDSGRGRLLWARSGSDRLGIRMALYRCDLASGSVTRLRFPERLGFVHQEAGSTVSVGSVRFSSNAQRMALLVQTVSPSGREGEPDLQRIACYSVETDGSGACLIRQMQPNAGSLYPAWSHDGRRLVILDSSGDSPRLFVYNYDGTGKRMAPLPTDRTASAAAP